MDTVVMCPDCGGVIGGDGHDGRKPCTCLEKVHAPIPGMPPPAVRIKVCCKCGKDIHDKKRFRDSLGYWCEACHYSEKRQANDQHTPCDACGRYVDKHKLTKYEGVKICTRCIKERKRQNHKARRPIVFGSEHQQYETNNTITLIIITLVLLLLIILSTTKVIPALP